MTKVRPTKGQMKMLVELVSNDPQLAASKFTANFTQKMSKERWNKIATELNAMLGAEKSGEKWKKAWQDARAATKTKAAALRRHINGTGGGPASHIIMSDVQNDVLPLLSQASVTGHCLSSESEVTFSFEDVVAKENNVIICNETGEFGFADGNEKFNFDDVENDVRPVDIIEQQLDVEHYQHIITVEVEQEKDKHQKLDVTASKIGNKCTPSKKKIMNNNTAAQCLADGANRKIEIKTDYYNKKIKMMDQKNLISIDKKNVAVSKMKLKSDYYNKKLKIMEQKNMILNELSMTLKSFIDK